VGVGTRKAFTFKHMPNTKLHLVRKPTQLLGLWSQYDDYIQIELEMHYTLLYEKGFALFKYQQAG